MARVVCPMIHSVSIERAKRATLGSREHISDGQVSVGSQRRDNAEKLLTKGWILSENMTCASAFWILMMHHE